MSRKAVVIVALAAAIAATTGVAFASNNGNIAHVRGADGEPASSIVEQVDDFSGEEVYYSDDAQTSELVAQGDLSDPAVAESETQSSEVEADDQRVDSDTDTDTDTDSDGDEVKTSSVKLPVANYTIQRVVDINNGEEILPQVVFGKYFNDCYLTLYNDSTMELCLNPAAGESESGSYSIDGDYLSVDFGNDRATAYKLLYTDEGAIDTIIVTSGSNVIYFG